MQPNSNNNTRTISLSPGSAHDILKPEIRTGARTLATSGGHAANDAVQLQLQISASATRDLTVT